MLMYVVGESEFGPCKIGYADRPRHRLSSLQTGNPRKLTLFCEVECPPNYRMAERIAHRLAAYGKRNEILCGEWFNITVQSAIKIVDEAIVRARKTHDRRVRARQWPPVGTRRG